MSNNRYKVKRDGSVIGNYTSSELRQMVVSGELKRDDHILQISSDKLKKSEWTKAGRIKRLGFEDENIAVEHDTLSDEFILEPESIPSSQFDKPYHRDLENDESTFNSFAIFAVITDKFVDWLSNTLGSGKLIKNKAAITQYGNLGLNIAIILYLVCSLWFAIKIDSMQFMLMAFGGACALGIGQFIAVRFIQAGSRLIDSSPTKINNMEIIRLLGFLIVAISVGICAFGIYYGVKLSQLEPAMVGILTLIIGIVGASLVFSPQYLNISRSDDASAGLELLGLVSFFVKMSVVLAPYIYLLGTIASIIFGLRGLYYMSQNELNGGAMMTSSALSFAIVASIFPLVIYLYFLVYYLLIDVIRAILDIDINVRNINKDKD